MVRKTSVAALLAVATAVAPGASFAFEPAQHRIEMRGFVPVICTLSFAPAVQGQGEGAFALGELREFCNAGSGYRILVEYEAGAMDGAMLRAGERMVVLSGDGRDVLVDAATANLRTSDLELVLPAGVDVAEGGLRLSIQAKTI